MPFPNVPRKDDRPLAKDEPTTGVSMKRERDAAEPERPRDRDATEDRASEERADPLDPLYRQVLVSPTPEPRAATEARVATDTVARASLEEILPALVRRIAWSGDGRKGAVRMELGAGALAGATLLIESEDGRVRVHLSAPPGVDAGAWRERILARLAEKRIAVEALSTD